MSIEPIKLTGETMGTTYNITAINGHVGQIDLKQRIDRALGRIDDQMSTWRHDSEISRFNGDRTGGWFVVSDEFLRVLDAARSVNQQTGGAFDITVGGLVNLWGFGASERRSEKPGTDSIKEKLAHVGHEKFEIDTDRTAIRKIDLETEIDVSGIAKGYAVDTVAEILLQSGFEDFIVEIGGEIRSAGRRPDGTPWRVAIERPDSGNRPIQMIIALDYASIATSGDYHNYFEIGDKRYSHIIDPKTGGPPENGVASVSVVTDEAMAADALATGLMVMSTDEALSLAAVNHLAVMIIERIGDDFRVIQSDSFEALRSASQAN